MKLSGKSVFALRGRGPRRNQGLPAQLVVEVASQVTIGARRTTSDFDAARDTHPIKVWSVAAMALPRLATDKSGEFPADAIQSPDERPCGLVP